MVTAVDEKLVCFRSSLQKEPHAITRDQYIQSSGNSEAGEPEGWVGRISGG